MYDFSRVINAGGKKPSNRTADTQQNQNRNWDQNPNNNYQNDNSTMQVGNLVRGSLANTIGHAASTAAATGTLSRKAAHRIIDAAFQTGGNYFAK